MQDVAFVVTAFGEKYVEQLYRLRDSINTIYPVNNTFYWENELPPGSKSFDDSLYGFKPHCVQYARERGYEKIIFLDPACILVDKIDDWFRMTNSVGVVAAEDSSSLADCCSEQAFNYFGVTRNIVRERGWHLVGGSAYIFDFARPLCNQIFYTWYEAERDGMFGSQEQAQSEQIQSHRNDESCMALSIYTSGSIPVPYSDCRYNDGERSIVIKNHFK
jgi:hypothetical protein